MANFNSVNALKKILIVRFSSIGDIVLTSPVVRCAKQQLPGVEVHFVSKSAFAGILTANPWIDRVHSFEKDVSEIYSQLKAERFDVVIDLHNNLRSSRLKRSLGVHSSSVNKLNVKKFLAVQFKMIGVLPARHIVDRYFDTLSQWGVRNDGMGLDYFIPANDEVSVAELLPTSAAFVALVAGGSYFTKQIPMNKLAEMCERLRYPVVVVGGKDDIAVAEQLKARYPHVVVACGRYNLNQSASIVRQAEWVITSDTGLMHIASAFGKKIISLWGNTIPEFGMAPYLPHPASRIVEVKGLSCRPCSKLGYRKCPRGHFKCMNTIDTSFAAEL